MGVEDRPAPDVGQPMVGAGSLHHGEGNARPAEDAPPGSPAAGLALEHRARRTPVVLLGVVVAAAAIWFAFGAFQDSVVFYLEPSEALHDAPQGSFRLAGLVVEGSVEQHAGVVRFEVTDGAATIPVRYTGRAPDMLDTGAEAVAEGRFGADGVFEADTVLTRCASKFEADLHP